MATILKVDILKGYLQAKYFGTPLGHISQSGGCTKLFFNLRIVKSHWWSIDQLNTASRAVLEGFCSEYVALRSVGRHFRRILQYLLDRSRRRRCDPSLLLLRQPDCVCSVNVSQEPRRAAGTCSGAARQGDDNRDRRQGEMFSAVEARQPTNAISPAHTHCTINELYTLCSELYPVQDRI